MRRQIELFFTALMFFTRLPCPKELPFSKEHLNHAARYFSLIGIIVGSFAAMVYLIATYAFNREIAILLSMLTSILMTGAFHEDGFCDSCDGFAGGQNKADILRIMKDSRIGAFGAIGIMLMLLFKFMSLASIPSLFVPSSLICAHALSRFFSNIFLFTHQYARLDDDASKSKPLAENISKRDLIICGAIAFIPLFLLFPIKTIAAILLVNTILFLCIGRYYNKKIQGYTGDALGAAQQIFELSFYLVLGCHVWKYI